MADKRAERMLEELVKQPGNNNCADCHAPAPRWASVTLGITLCVTCASIHRSLGTHTSRVKSLTLDSWSREHLNALKSIGNTASNAIYNPDERRHPPPTSSAADERDSEMEKYIRKKYELGAFKAGAAAGSGGKILEPTSMNRYRQTSGRDANAWDRTQENRRNPELNDLVVRMEKKNERERERELPPLPISANSTGARERPRPSTATTTTGAGASQPPSLSTSPAPGAISIPRPGSAGPRMNTPHTQGGLAPPPTLIDFGGGGGAGRPSINSTRPLQALAPPPGFSPQPQQPQNFGAFLSPSSQAISPHQHQHQQLSPSNYNNGGFGGSYFPSSASTSTTPLQSPPTFMHSQPQYPTPPQQQQQQHQLQAPFNPFFAQQHQQPQPTGFYPQQQQLQPMQSPNANSMPTAIGNPFFQGQPNAHMGFNGQSEQYQMSQGQGGGMNMGWGQQQQPQPPNMGMGMGWQQGQSQGQGLPMGYAYAQGQ